MRLSAEMIASAEQRPNPLGERELVLRGMGIPALEHLGATRDAFDAMDFSNNRISRLDNLPKLERLRHLMLSGNAIDTVVVTTTTTTNNTPNMASLTLSYNRIQSLSQIVNLAQLFPKLEFLSLVGNPVTRRQFYRLYTIRQFPRLRSLDMMRVKQSERDKAERLAKSAAGASMEHDIRREEQQQQQTFEPGEGQSAEESFVTSFTTEQQATIRRLVENAKSPQDIERIEEAVKRGEFPSFAMPENDNNNNNNNNGNNDKKRAADTSAATTASAEKRPRTT